MQLAELHDRAPPELLGEPWPPGPVLFHGWKLPDNQER